MNTAKFALLAGGTLLLTAATGLAQSTNNWFLTGDAGAAIVQNANIRSSPFGNSGNLQLDTGFRGGFDLGYQLQPAWAVAFESGVVWNGINSIAGNNPNEGASANLYQVPILAKVIYTPLHGKFQPFVSAGVGGVASIFDLSNVSNGSSIGIFAPNFNATSWSVAYQAEIGFRYQIARSWDVGLKYAFLGTTDQNWSDHGVVFDTAAIYTHAIEASLTWHF